MDGSHELENPSHLPVRENIPQALVARSQWVGWRYEKREGRLTKVPLNSRTGARAKSTDPSTWSTFDEAIRSMEAHADYAGVGFVFAKDDPFTGIDLDGCADEAGNVVPSARDIVENFATYAEVSPSGTGVKLFLVGTKPEGAQCRSKVIKGFKEIEIYSNGRFFAVTGRRLAGAPETVELRQAELDALCLRLWPLKPKRAAATAALGGFPGDDEALIKQACSAKNGEEFGRLFFEGDTSMHGGDDSAADLAMCCHLAFWTGRDPVRMDRLFRRSRLFRDKWERQDYRERTIRKAIEGCSEVYTPRRVRKGPTMTHPTAAQGRSDDRPEILIDTDEHRVIADTVRALGRDPNLYQRGNVLVRVMRDGALKDGINRAAGSATIAAVPAANLRERLTRCARFVGYNRDGDVVATHPKPWLVGAIEVRGDWPGIRRLVGVSDAPVLRADGSIWQTAGYDGQTGVLYEPATAFPAISDRPTIDDARAAVGGLLQVVGDFRLESDAHKAAYVASVLTPLARFAFDGPAPMFLVDANVRGAGKGLLVQTVAHIVLGGEMAVSSYAHDPEEMRKKITSIAVAGDRIVLLDNLEGRLGNDALDRALTSTRWRDRILGKSEQVELPLLAVWFAAGNNVSVGADSARRIIHIRLDVLEERPEHRDDFAHPRLLAWFHEHRGRLLAAALTILSAYLRAGRPSMGLRPFGGFDGWSGLVRETVVWAGLPDPCDTQETLVAYADATQDTLARLVAAWRLCDPQGRGLVLTEVVARLCPPPRESAPGDEASVAMRSALEDLVGGQAGKPFSARQVGNKLKRLRRRPCQGSYLDFDAAEKCRAGVLWRLHNKVVCDSASHASQKPTPTREEQDEQN